MPVNSRRSLVCSVFFCFAIVPTALIAFAAYYVNRPEYPGEVAARLSRQLGVAVTLREVRYPVPGAVEYGGLVLHDGRGTKLTAGRIRLRRTGRRWHVEAHELRVALPRQGSRRRSDGAASGQHNVLAEVLRSFPPPGESIVLAASDVTVITARGTYHVDHATTCYYVDSTGRPRVAGQLESAEAGMTAPASVELVLSKDGNLNVEQFRLDTRAAELPVPEALRLATLPDWLGERATFRGNLVAKRTGLGWGFDIRGRLAHVDLHQVAEQFLPFPLTGPADWSIDAARWRDGQLLALRGHVQAGPGRVSTELLRALARNAGFLVSLRVPARGTVVYQKMAFGFSIDGGTVRMTGNCDETIDDLVMIGEHGEPLLRGPLGSASMLGFARALSRRPRRRTIVPTGYEPAALRQVVPATPEEPAQR